jgi:hypothetical protein
VGDDNTHRQQEAPTKDHEDLKMEGERGGHEGDTGAWRSGMEGRGGTVNMCAMMACQLESSTVQHIESHRLLYVVWCGLISRVTHITMATTKM